MKLPALLLLAGLFFPAPALQDQEKEKKQEPPKKSDNPVTRFFEDAAESLTKELDGSWMLLDYTDPQMPVEAGQARGFLTFHEGFLSWLLTIDSSEQSLFGLRSFLILDSGAYRYRVDEQANLQLAAVMSFTNNTDDGNVDQDPPGTTFEYIAKIEDNVLELRDTEGIVITFRKVEAGDFPDSAVRRLEEQRSGTEAWQEVDTGK
jgi:hypothetical protein